MALSAKAQERFSGNNTRFPKLAEKFNSREWKETISRKCNGAGYGPTLEKGLPILEQLAGMKVLPKSVEGFFHKELEYFGSEKFNSWTRAGLILCGRSEGAHSRGKKLFSGIAGQEGDSSNAAVVASRASTLLHKLEVLQHNIKRSQARKGRVKAPRTRKVQDSKAANTMPAGNAG